MGVVIIRHKIPKEIFALIALKSQEPNVYEEGLIVMWPFTKRSYVASVRCKNLVCIRRIFATDVPVDWIQKNWNYKQRKLMKMIPPSAKIISVSAHTALETRNLIYVSSFRNDWQWWIALLIIWNQILTLVSIIVRVPSTDLWLTSGFADLDCGKYSCIPLPDG